MINASGLEPRVLELASSGSQCHCISRNGLFDFTCQSRRLIPSVVYRFWSQCIKNQLNFNPSQLMQVHIPGIFSKAFIKVHLKEIGTSVVQFLIAHCWNTALKATLSGSL